VALDEYEKGFTSARLDQVFSQARALPYPIPAGPAAEGRPVTPGPDLPRRQGAPVGPHARALSAAVPPPVPHARRVWDV
jgi:hypothetical protein